MDKILHQLATLGNGIILDIIIRGCLPSANWCKISPSTVQGIDSLTLNKRQIERQHQFQHETYGGNSEKFEEDEG